MEIPYLYESQGIEIALSNSEIDTVFWNAAAPGVPTEHINRLFPENAFGYIITSNNNLIIRITVCDGSYEDCIIKCCRLSRRFVCRRN